MLHPSYAKCIAMVLPIPLAAPVMRAVLFSNNNFIFVCVMSVCRLGTLTVLHLVIVYFVFSYGFYQCQSLGNFCFRHSDHVLA